VIRMIVNADDFGYFDNVSRGILEAAEQGVVTATGVMANGPALPRWIERLRNTPGLSVGVHLNATLGVPLTAAMRAAVAPHGGSFPGKGVLVASVLRGAIPAQVVLDEWRAQLDHCRNAGLKLDFLNSHEHMHMLPLLHARVRALAAEFGIPNVRAPHPEWSPGTGLGGAVRSALFGAMQLATPAGAESEPVLIGVAKSGKLDIEYCQWRFARLREGGVYELMCHPGRDDAEARRDPKLADYHDWEGELATITGTAFRSLLEARQIRLVSYAGAGARA
jgi:predicted glycoside hydrolase/deacetylase ChbG (UPF0249 family)